MGITFVAPRWVEPPELLTLWNVGFDEKRLEKPCTVHETKIGDFLYSFSDGLNDSKNELGWDYRVIPLRNPPK